MSPSQRATCGADAPRPAVRRRRSPRRAAAAAVVERRPARRPSRPRRRPAPRRGPRPPARRAAAASGAAARLLVLHRLLSVGRRGPARQARLTGPRQDPVAVGQRLGRELEVVRRGLRADRTAAAAPAAPPLADRPSLGSAEGAEGAPDQRQHVDELALGRARRPSRRPGPAARGRGPAAAPPSAKKPSTQRGLVRRRDAVPRARDAAAPAAVGRSGPRRAARRTIRPASRPCRSVAVDQPGQRRRASGAELDGRPRRASSPTALRAPRPAARASPGARRRPGR